MAGPQDTQSSLADIDRKLRELQQELSRVFEHPAQKADAGASPAPASSPPDAGPASAVADDAADRPEEVTPPPPTAAPSEALSRPLAPGVQAEALVAAASQAQRQTTAPPPAADTPAAGGDNGRTAQLVGELSHHIDALQRLRDELQSSLAARAEPPATPTPPSAPAAATAPRAPAPPAPAPPRPAPPPAAAEPAPPAPALPPPSAASAPPPDPATIAPPPPLSATDRRPAFQGSVIVNAGPFVDIGTMGAFEHALANLPGAEDVYVRSFEGNRALIDLKLEQPVHLVEEMQRVLPFSFGVVEVGHQLLTINVDPPSGPLHRPDPAGEEAPKP